MTIRSFGSLSPSSCGSNSHGSLSGSSRRAPAILALGQPLVDSLIKVTDEELHSLGIHDKGGSVLINNETDFIDLWNRVRALGKDITLCPGGSASNTIKAIAAFGTPSGLIGKIGDDEIGRVFSTALRKRGVNDLTSKSFQSKTGQVLCFVTEDGQRTMRAYLGASLEMSASDLLEEDFASFSLLHIEGYAIYNEKLLNATLQLAAKNKLTVSYDIGSYQIAEAKSKVLKRMLRDYVSIAFCNETEAETLFPETNGDLKLACKKLGKLVRIAVITCGKEGCYIKNAQGEIFHFSSIPVDSPVDTTGAGDIFSAAFLYGINSGFSLPAAARLGSLAGHHIVQLVGAELPKHKIQLIKSEVNNPTQIRDRSSLKSSKSIPMGSPSSGSIPIRA